MHDCEWFKNMLSNIGEKGFAVMARRNGTDRAFYLEARPFEADVVRRYSASAASEDRPRWPALEDASGMEVPYTTSMILRLSHCPGCGVRLSEVIDANIDLFDALAVEQQAANPEFEIYNREYPRE